MKMLRHKKMLATILLASGLTACANLSQDGGEQQVRTQAEQKLGIASAEANSNEARKILRDQLLAQPLDSDNAVRVALLNNPGLQVRFAELRITETELVAAARPRNPGVSLAYLSQGNENETDRAVTLDIIGLLTAPMRAPLAESQFDSAKLAATQDVLTLARDTRMAWVEAIAAQQRLGYAGDVLIAAEAGRDLAKTLQEAGNISALDSERELAFYNEALALQKRAQIEANSTRIALLRILGIDDASSVTLPSTLPALPEQARKLKNVEQQALNQRLDVQQAKQDLENTARSLKLTKTTRFINVLDLGYQHNSYSDQTKQTGFDVSFELPIFDGGSTKTAEAEAIYQRALAQTGETALKACSEARDAYQRYQTAWELAQHYRDGVIPAQQKISDETVLRYNGMLISAFELLAQTREQVASTESGMNALRDFWIADAQLNSVLQ